MQKNLPESELAGPVSEWLKGQGFKVFFDVPNGTRFIDVIGLRITDDGHELVAVVINVHWSQELIGQCKHADFSVDACYGATPARPTAKTLPRFVDKGFGALLVRNGLVTVLAHANQKYIPNDRRKKKIVAYLLTKWAEDTHAQKDPVKDCTMRVAEYKQHNPDAAWKEIFKNVPNHYSSAQSMYNALYNARRKSV